MALFRAVESARSAADRLFDDPFAPLFLRPSLYSVLQLSRIPGVRGLILHVLDNRWPGARSSGVARTRLIDDWLRAALADGATQVVILGAGFDCRAYRLPELSGAHVFEVDHPDTLAAKSRGLRRAFAAFPAHVTLVPVDFNTQRADAALSAAGYRATLRTAFVWEGVTNYLAPDAVDAMFRWFATATPGSQVMFTYVHRRVLEAPATFEGTQRLVRTLQRRGESWTFGLDPAETRAYLGARGLELTEDLGAAEYRSRYLGQRRGHTGGYEFYRAAVARVAVSAHTG